MEAAWPVSKGARRDVGVVPAPVGAVLDRVARLAARTLDAADVAILVLHGSDPRSLVLVARCCRDPERVDDHSADPLLERMLATGGAVAAEGADGLQAAAPLTWENEVRGALM